MQEGWSYIKESGDFINKTKTLAVLYPSIPHETGLRALRKALDKQEVKCIPTKDLVKMEEFVLKNN